MSVESILISNELQKRKSSRFSVRNIASNDELFGLQPNECAILNAILIRSNDSEFALQVFSSLQTLDLNQNNTTPIPDGSGAFFRYAYTVPLVIVGLPLFTFANPLDIYAAQGSVFTFYSDESDAIDFELTFPKRENLGKINVDAPKKSVEYFDERNYKPYSKTIVKGNEVSKTLYENLENQDFIEKHFNLEIEFGDISTRQKIDTIAGLGLALNDLAYYLKINISKVGLGYTFAIGSEGNRLKLLTTHYVILNGQNPFRDFLHNYCFALIYNAGDNYFEVEQVLQAFKPTYVKRIIDFDNQKGYKKKWNEAYLVLTLILERFIIYLIEEENGKNPFLNLKYDNDVEKRTVIYPTAKEIEANIFVLENWVKSFNSKIQVYEEPNNLPNNDCETLDYQNVDIQAKDVFAIWFDTKKIKTDTKRFQNRDTEFSQESVKRIVEDFDINRFEPLRIWYDSTDNQYYVLSGHSRLQASKILDLPKIPVVFFEGNENEAIDFAKFYANRGATPETIIEDLKLFKQQKEQGLSVADLKKRWKERYDRLEAFSYLNPNGSFIQQMSLSERQQLNSTPFLELRASWVGMLRKQFPKISNLNEQEIFDWLYVQANNYKLTKSDFLAQIESKVSNPFFNGESLRLFSKGKTGVEARSDTAQSAEKIKELIATNKKLEDLTKKDAKNKDYYKTLIDKNAKEIAYLQKGIVQSVTSQKSLLGTKFL